MTNVFRSRKTGLLVLVLLLAGLLLPYSSPAVGAGKPSPIDSGLATALASSSARQQISVIVFLADEVDPKTVSGKNKAEKQKNLIQLLHQRWVLPQQAC